MAKKGLPKARAREKAKAKARNVGIKAAAKVLAANYTARKRLREKTRETALVIHPSTPAAAHKATSGHYDTLQIGRAARPNVVRKAYKARALITHPDKQGGSTVAFLKALAAFEVLIDENARKLYDDELRHSGSTDGHHWSTSQPGKHTADPSDGNGQAAEASATTPNPQDLRKAIDAWIKTFSEDADISSFSMVQLLNLDDFMQKQAGVAELSSDPTAVKPAATSSETIKYLLRNKSGYRVEVIWNRLKVYTQFTNSLSDAIEWQMSLMTMRQRALDRLASGASQQILVEDELLGALCENPVMRLTYRVSIGRSSYSPTTRDLRLCQSYWRYSGESGSVNLKLFEKWKKDASVDNQRSIRMQSEQSARLWKSVRKKMLTGARDYDSKPDRRGGIVDDHVSTIRLLQLLNLSGPAVADAATKLALLPAHELSKRRAHLRAPYGARALEDTSQSARNQRSQNLKVVSRGKVSKASLVAIASTAQAVAGSFHAAAEYEGQRPGYVFKRGDDGLGYYIDLLSVRRLEASSSAEASSRAQPSRKTPRTPPLPDPVGDAQAQGPDKRKAPQRSMREEPPAKIRKVQVSRGRLPSRSLKCGELFMEQRKSLVKQTPWLHVTPKDGQSSCEVLSCLTLKELGVLQAASMTMYVSKDEEVRKRLRVLSYDSKLFGFNQARKVSQSGRIVHPVNPLKQTADRVSSFLNGFGHIIQELHFENAPKGLLEDPTMVSALSQLSAVSHVTYAADGWTSTIAKRRVVQALREGVAFVYVDKYGRATTHGVAGQRALR